MVAIAGMRGTGDWGPDERPKNFREMILWLNPNGTAPMFALSSKASSESVNDPEFSWWEETLTIVRLTVNGALTSSATTVVVDSGALNLRIGDLLLAEADTETSNYADEILYVSGVTDDTTFTVSRGARGSTAAAISDNASLTLIGNVFEEGSVSPEATSRNPTKKRNYCQIFKTAYELTGTALETKTRTGNPKQNDKKRRMFDHSRALELSMFFGKAYEDTGSGGKPRRSTGGILEFLASDSRVTVKSAAYTDINEVFDDLVDVFDYQADDGGSDERLVWAGNGALRTVNKLAKKDGTIEFRDVVKQWGMNLTRLITPHGTFFFKSHPLFNVHNRFTNTMFVVNPAGLRYRHLRDTKPMENIQPNDQDTLKGQWLTEAGFEIHHTLTMKCITNISYA